MLASTSSSSASPALRRTPLLVGLLWLAGSAQALYFTNPAAGDVWASTSGKTLTWKHQAGDATVGTFIIESEV